MYAIHQTVKSRSLYMEHISVINIISVPEGMEAEAESIRSRYVEYFKKQSGFISSTFYRSISREEEGSIKYVNIIVWESKLHFDRVVNKGFDNEDGENSDGMLVLGKGFPEPIKVSPGQYQIIEHNA